jgi:hypothetical protein
LRVEDGREQTGISRKLREADQEPEKEKPAEQSIPSTERTADKKAIIDNIERCSGAPVRPWRESKQRNCHDVDDNRREHNRKASAFERNIFRVHNSSLPTNRWQQ